MTTHVDPWTSCPPDGVPSSSQVVRPTPCRTHLAGVSAQAGEASARGCLMGRQACHKAPEASYPPYLEAGPSMSATGGGSRPTPRSASAPRGSGSPPPSSRGTPTRRMVTQGPRSRRGPHHAGVVSDRHPRPGGVGNALAPPQKGGERCRPQELRPSRQAVTRFGARRAAGGQEDHLGAHGRMARHRGESCRYRLPTTRRVRARLARRGRRPRHSGDQVNTRRASTAERRHGSSRRQSSEGTNPMDATGMKEDRTDWRGAKR